MTTIAQAKVLLIGAGNMGSAVGAAIREAGVAKQRLRVLNSSAESSADSALLIDATSAFEAAETTEWEKALRIGARWASVIVLGIKPYQMQQVLPVLARELREDTLVISLAAGVTIERLTHLLGGHASVVRTMPNTPVVVGEGVVALMPARGASEADVALVRSLFAKSAHVLQVAESKVHQVIGAAGSAPAFFFLVAEAMIDEAVAQGLTRNMATDLVVSTMKGSAQLLKELEKSPAEARYGVTSPGGTTARGVAALEEAGVRTAFAKAMRAAADRSREMERD